MTCNCIQEIDAQLEKLSKNTVLDIPVSILPITHNLSVTRVSISTCKRDSKKRGKPVTVFASYCPFCGEEYKVEGGSKNDNDK